MVMTKAQSTSIVGHIFGAGGQEPTDVVVNSWHDSIKEFDYTLAVHAAKIYKSTEAGFRSVARYTTIYNGLVNAPIPSTAEALSEAIDAMRIHGSATMPTFKNPYIEPAIGGWSTWREWGMSENTIWHHTFSKSYERVVERRVTEQKIELSSPTTAAFLRELAQKFDAGDGPKELGQGDVENPDDPDSGVSSIVKI